MSSKVIFKRKIDKYGCLIGTIQIGDEFFISLYQLLEQLNIKELQALNKRISNMIIANANSE